MDVGAAPPGRPRRARRRASAAPALLLLLISSTAAAAAAAEPPPQQLCQPGLLKLDEPRGPPERSALPFCDQVRGCGALDAHTRTHAVDTLLRSDGSAPRPHASSARRRRIVHSSPALLKPPAHPALHTATRSSPEDAAS